MNRFSQPNTPSVSVAPLRLCEQTGQFLRGRVAICPPLILQVSQLVAVDAGHLLVYGLVDNVGQCGLSIDGRAYDDLMRISERLFYDDRTVLGTSLTLTAYQRTGRYYVRVAANESTLE